MHAQNAQISAITEELLHTGEKVAIQKTVIDAQTAQILGWPKELANNKLIWDAEKESLQDKIKGLWKWVAGLGALDVALLLILLL